MKAVIPCVQAATPRVLTAHKKNPNFNPNPNLNPHPNPNPNPGHQEEPQPPLGPSLRVERPAARALGGAAAARAPRLRYALEGRSAWRRCGRPAWPHARRSLRLHRTAQHSGAGAPDLQLDARRRRRPGTTRAAVGRTTRCATRSTTTNAAGAIATATTATGATGTTRATSQRAAWPTARRAAWPTAKPTIWPATSQPWQPTATAAAARTHDRAATDNATCDADGHAPEATVAVGATPANTDRATARTTREKGRGGGGTVRRRRRREVRGVLQDGVRCRAHHSQGQLVPPAVPPLLGVPHHPRRRQLVHGHQRPPLLQAALHPEATRGGDYTQKLLLQADSEAPTQKLRGRRLRARARQPRSNTRRCATRRCATHRRATRRRATRLHCCARPADAFKVDAANREHARACASTCAGVRARARARTRICAHARTHARTRCNGAAGARVLGLYQQRVAAARRSGCRLGNGQLGCYRACARARANAKPLAGAGAAACTRQTSKQAACSR